MATNTITNMTLIERANRTNNGTLMAIAEILAEDNPIVQDAPMIEANNALFHKSVRRDSIPGGTFRQLNKGVSKETTTTVDVIDGIGLLESYAENDKVLIDSFPNPKEARMQESRGFIEGMTQTLADTVFYGNSNTDKEKFDGLACRIPAIDADGNCIDEGGSGSTCTSIYIVQWGVGKVHMIYPRGSQTMGVEHDDLGEHTVKDSDGNQFQAYRDHFKAYLGLVVRDSRCIARLASVSTSAVVDEDNLIYLLNRMPQSGRGAHIYCNPEVLSQMEIALKDKTNVNYTPGGGEGLAGEPLIKFRGCPVKACDSIIMTEAAL